MEAVVNDEVFMAEALELAERGRGLVSPNPLVGAVVVQGDAMVGRGWHEGPGNAHAEVLALGDAGERARGATMVTTLEPCDHYGRTPPCSVAIIESGIGRVVAPMRDPNPAVDGRGFARLAEAGIEVATGVLAEKARRQNEAFLKHVQTGLPFVTLKMAATLDGKVAARDGSSRWITGETARAEVHAMRAGADAIMVGAGTVLIDDPSLTVRDEEYRGAPVLRVVVDARGRVSETARVFSEHAPTLVATTEDAPRDRREAWRSVGADVVVYEPADGSVPLGHVFADLGKRDVQSVLLEGGPTIAWTAVHEGLVDKLVVFLAPSLIGGADAPGILGGEGFAPIGEAVSLELTEVERIGLDVKVEAYVHRDR
jgi:diaminohydroxyphosphoribosylaminopyrimidine deaminase/5-amino-6-(5-phosphoribosylamino)uracil reductase